MRINDTTGCSFGIRTKEMLRKNKKEMRIEELGTKIATENWKPIATGSIHSQGSWEDRVGHRLQQFSTINKSFENEKFFGK